MKRTVRLTNKARRDLSRLEEFLVTKNPDAASRAVETLVTAVLSLAERGQAGPSDLRRINVPCGNSGYVVWYRIFATNVLVARIKHARER